MQPAKLELHHLHCGEKYFQIPNTPYIELHRRHIVETKNESSHTVDMQNFRVTGRKITDPSFCEYEEFHITQTGIKITHPSHHRDK